jgi:hypothetical protein
MSAHQGLLVSVDRQQVLRLSEDQACLGKCAGPGCVRLGGGSVQQHLSPGQITSQLSIAARSRPEDQPVQRVQRRMGRDRQGGRGSGRRED